MVVSHKYNVPCLKDGQVLGEKENCIICFGDFTAGQEDQPTADKVPGRAADRVWHDLARDDYVVVLPCGLDGCHREDAQRESWYLKLFRDSQSAASDEEESPNDRANCNQKRPVTPQPEVTCKM